MNYYDKADDGHFFREALRDIAYFHKLYAKDKDPKWIDISKNLDVMCTNLRNRRLAKESEG